MQAVEEWTHRVERGELAAAVRAAVAREAAMDRERSIAVVAAPATLATLALPEEVVPLSPVEAAAAGFAPSPAVEAALLSVR